MTSSTVKTIIINEQYYLVRIKGNINRQDKQNIFSENVAVKMCLMSDKNKPFLKKNRHSSTILNELNINVSII